MTLDVFIRLVKKGSLREISPLGVDRSNPHCSSQVVNFGILLLAETDLIIETALDKIARNC